MYNAELYMEYNDVARVTAKEYLEKFNDKIKWKNNCRVVDLGSADGSVTSILKKCLPLNFKELIGCDISEKMVEFCNEKYKDDTMEFRVWDIGTDVPEDLKGRFDHVYSSYTVMWVHDQERVFSNIFDILADDGNCFLLFIAQSPIFDAMRILYNREKWRSWLSNIHTFIWPYHDSQQLFRNILRPYLSLIENKDLSTNTNKEKMKAWCEITEKFNLANIRTRDKKQLINQWKCLKITSKKEISSYRREITRTGGGPKPPSPSPGTIEVAEMIPQEFEVDFNEFDCDGVQDITNQVIFEEIYKEREKKTKVSDTFVNENMNIRNDQDFPTEVIKDGPQSEHPITTPKKTTKKTPEPTKEVISLMEKKGFTNIDVSCNWITYIFGTVNDYRELMRALNPFKITDEEIMEQYLDELVEASRNELKLMEIIDDKEVVKINFTLMVAFGLKPKSKQ